MKGGGWGGKKTTKRLVITAPFWEREGFLNCPGLRSCTRSFLYRPSERQMGLGPVWGADAGIRTRSQLCLELREAAERSRWALIARWWISLLLFNSALIAGLPGGWDALISVAEDPDPDYPPTTETVRRSVGGLEPIIFPLSHLVLDFFLVGKSDQARLGGILLDLKKLKRVVARVLKFPQRPPLTSSFTYLQKT